MDDDGLLQGFFDESADLLADFEGCLLRLETNPGDQELLNKSFRAIHTIKGNSGMLGFDGIAKTAHALEDLLDRLRKNEFPLTRPCADLLLRSADVIKGLFAEAKGERAEGVRDGELIKALKGFLDRGKEAAWPDPSRTERVYAIRLLPDPLALERGIDLFQVFHDLKRLATIEGIDVDVTQLPPLDDLDPERCYLEWRLRVRTALDSGALAKIFDFVGEGGVVEISPAAEVAAAIPHVKRGEVPRIGELLLEEKAITPTQLDEALRKHKKVGEILVEERALTPERLTGALEKQKLIQQKQESSTIRVNTDKVDRLINLVGELVITHLMISQLVTNYKTEALPLLEGAVAQMERNTRELQERVMAIRMLPIRTIFGRLPRLVRDLAAQCGKKIAIQLKGEETELDKTVIERIGDPLTHLIRNAVDHGIEPPPQRLAQGKPDEGMITLNAFHQGGSIFIEVADDGRGLDRERIVRKAAERGMIADGDALTDDQVYRLIFKPGFSTAEQVTDVSGRGVGMDVVLRNAEELGGSIAIATGVGRGTRFTIKLPLTLAIMDGLSIQVGDEVYIIPLVSIIESIRPKQADLGRVASRGDVVCVRGQFLPIIRLYELFGVTPRVLDPTQSLLVIVEQEGRKMALLVDELLGQHQVVIKSLEANFRRVPGIAGATIMGDGRPALILDMAGISQIARGAEGIALVRAAAA